MLAIVPDNPLRAAVNGDMLAVMFFSLMVGIGLAMAARETVAPLIAVLEGLYAVVMKVIELAMRLAPYGVAALLFTLTARLGAGVLRQLAELRAGRARRARDPPVRDLRADRPVSSAACHRASSSSASAR